MEVLNTTSPKRVPDATASPSNTEPSSSTRRPEEGLDFKSAGFLSPIPSGAAKGYHGPAFAKGDDSMRHPRPAILFLAALLASATLLLAASAYTIFLKDGSSLVARQKYTVQNGRAIIILLNGTETFVALDKIDIPRTDAANKG